MDRKATDELVAALKSAGVTVISVERRIDEGDADLIHLNGDDYLAVDYEDFVRIGVVGVSLDTGMEVGGNVNHESWLMPPSGADAIATAVASAI